MNTKKTILVIDDDRKFQQGLVAVLRREGFEVHQANNGVEGMASIMSGIPDIILCDIMMPPPNGIEFKKQLSNDPMYSQIPFIYLSARTENVDKLIGFDSGADDYITKPFEVDELLARIQTVMRRFQHVRQTKSQQRIQELAKLREGISGIISHEMLTPLKNLQMTMEAILTVKTQQEAPRQDALVTTYNNNAYRLKFLIEDLDILYDMSEGNLVYFDQRIDLDSQVTDPIQKILTLWEAKQLQVQISIDPNTLIFAPQEKFSHIIAHMVDNACKFSPEKGKVQISLQPNVAHGCIFEVINQNNGIPLEIREKGVERYYQISPRDAQGIGGLGVGLTIARAYARAWDGDIQIIDSDEDYRVRMVLPLMSKK